MRWNPALNQWRDNMCGMLWLAIPALAGLITVSESRTGPPVQSEEVIARMEEFGRARQTALRSYRCLRTYKAANASFRREASAVVELNYSAPDQKRFRVLESNGSRTIVKRVIEPLLASEQKTARQQERQATDISRQNYSFTFVDIDLGRDAYIFAAEPLTRNKYLFRGKIWIDKQTLGISRIEGEPAKSPSFWVRRTHFIHQYARFGDFWFPISNRAEVEMRLFGRSTLSIDYYDYQWQENPRTIAK